jgi:glutamate-1-semialdehyde 2,1-aminomutase
MTQTLLIALAVALGLLATAVLVLKLRDRLRLSRAKHRSLAGHVRIARRIAGMIPFYDFDESAFFDADGAPSAVRDNRRRGFDRLSQYFRAHRARSRSALAELDGKVPDAAFIARYRVPFQFSRVVREALHPGVMVERSDHVLLTDLDANQWMDAGGAYGVNVFGYDFYKACLKEAGQVAGDLGPVLGPYHPVVVETVRRLREVSGQDEVSFHMSGTEAVMQAVRMARYHTRRSHVVRFAGAYHGWWDEVQPGIGNPGQVGQVHTLEEMSQATLKVLATRKDIACVLVNPLQALHPNRNAPGDGALVAGRRAGFDREAYTRWLEQLRAVCSERGIVLILDEVFLGFRLGRGGAQEWFGVKADLVTYGKTLGGGLPVGVVCGRSDLMQRYREHRPLDICFARGTFNAHPWVMAAMNAFLKRLDSEPVRAAYDGIDERWSARADRLNGALQSAGLPVRASHLSSVFLLTYSKPSRYNWMFQFYLNAEGLLLPWVGTGRLIFSLNYTEADFDEVIERIVRAGQTMASDGWWWHPEGATPSSIGKTVLKELLTARFRRQRASASDPSGVTIGS